MIVKADIHCHLLHCVDDGSSGLEESLELLRLEAQDGVKYICVTPHLRHRMFETPDEEVIRRFKQLKEAKDQAQIPVRLFLSREYHYDRMLAQTLQNRSLISIGGRTVLTEFSFHTPFDSIQNAVRKLTELELVPLIAHIERYGEIQDDPELAGVLKEDGALIQINAGAVLGEDGRKERQTAEALLKSHLVYTICSDAHNVRERVPNLGKCEKLIEKKFGERKARQLLFTNPIQLIRY